MKQLKIIDKLAKLFPKISGIQASLLYGSFGRNQGTPNSDVDIQLIVDKEFNTKEFIDLVQIEFQSEIFSIYEISQRNKVVAYFKQQPKVEFAICRKIDEIVRDYQGSEITTITHTILFEKQPAIYELESYLNQLKSEKNHSEISNERARQVSGLVHKFLYEFESCSAMHRRSDGYQFYFFYNIALHAAIQLNQLSKGQSKFNFLPKKFIANVLTKVEHEAFYELRGTLFLPEANLQKRRLLDFFYAAIKSLLAAERIKEIIDFCEAIYQRDYFWNFRDLSTFNPKIKQGILFRSATLTGFQNDSCFEHLLKTKNIKTIIDLRAEQEIHDMRYSNETLSKFNYVKAHFDPWNQPEWFRNDYRFGTNEEIAYRFFSIGCRDQIKSCMEAVLDENNGGTVIHCFAGKDRTGIVVTLLHLLSEAPDEVIHSDYLASEVDVNFERLKILLDIIDEKGGIESYLHWCGLKLQQIENIKQKILD